MAFSREELEAYEKRPQTQVDDKTNPFTGTTPAAATKQTTDASVTVEVDDDYDEPDLEAAPSGDEVVADPDGQGDGTSDDTGANADPSTADTAAPSGETETAEVTETDGSTIQPPPKKGSARERIQELVDERDGFKAYGGYAQEQIAARDREIADLRKRVAAPVTTATAAPVVEVEEPMPAMEDPRINYDPVKYKVEVEAWADRRAAKQVKAAVAAAPVQNTEVQKVLETYNSRAAKFAETHKDFVEAVSALPNFGTPAARTLVLSEDGPDILYWLGKHKVDAVRIAKLSPDEQVFELGAIRTTIKRGKTAVIPPKNQTPAPDASKTQVKPKSTSSAPPPPTRVSAGNRSQARDVQDPTLSMDDFARRHYQERQAQRTVSRKLRGLS